MALTFAFGGDTGETPESIKRKRAIAQALLASQRAPRNVGEGLNALGDGIVANVLGRRADAAEQEGISSANEAFSPILASLGFGAFPAAPAAPSGGAPVGAVERAPLDPASARVAQAHGDGDMSAYRNAIASIESAGSGDYAAIGPTHPKLGRALGRYQVMEANIGPWTEAALGQAMTPEQFLADPKAQDAVFDHVFGGYVDQFGPAGAAQAWFAGPGGVGKTSRQDSLGTSVGEYGDKFMSALGGSQPANPQIAQALTQPSTRPEMAGRSNTPSLGMLLGASGNEFLNPSQRGIIEALTQQRMKEMDPMTALERRKMELELRNLENPQPELTDDMREYEFAKSQGFEGSFTDFMTAMRKAGATNVNVGQGEVGTIPQGFELFTDPQTGARSMRPIPGGPAASEAEAAAQAEQSRREGEVERGGLVAEEIDRALGVMDTGILPDTGFGAFLSGVPGTDAKALASRLDTIKANIGFEELNKMRQQSPTGGALGQVTERELAFLQSVAGSLDQAQSDEDLRYNLNRLWNAYMETIHGGGNFEPRPLGKAPEGGKRNRTSSGIEWSLD